ncbi:MAG: alpha-2-macroglobulin, partial [Spirochaetales bacterium]
MRELASGVADRDGLVQLKPSDLSSSEPTFLVVAAAKATTGRERGYLKLAPSQQLAVSHFDVGGEKAETGVKGFIYGERGVWRPGDDIHLVFMLYDRLKTLPADHPITFEFENPLGQVVRQATYTQSVGGFYYIKTGTEATSPTGTWTARIQVGGKTFAKSVKVETIMPNRLKLALDYGDKPYIAADLSRMGITAAWLHGAPAPGLKADVSMVLSASAKAPGNFPGYSFLDPMRTLQPERQVLFDGFLDDSGKADFAVYLSPDYESPGPLAASFLTRAFERSGLFSSEQFSVDFHPYERYVGVKLPAGDASRGMLLTDTDHAVELILVDRDGKAVSDGQVQVAVYKLQWRWWWEKGEESLAEHASDVYKRLLAKETVNVRNGRGTYKLNIKYPEWGRYLIRVEDTRGGHAAGTVFYMDWPGWAGRGRAEGGGSAAMLSLSADKDVYSVGDAVRVSFPSNKEGHAFVTTERAGRIIDRRWIDAKDGTTVYDFKATADMAPNVYVHVSFVQPHLQTANDLPIRLYGVVPVTIENPATRLDPVIKAPAALEPNTASTFTVSEKSGKAMTYTVAVVDEGLLGITRYSTPNPWNEFYKKEASILSSFDMFKDVAGAYTGKLQTLLAIGGSEFGDGGGTRKVSRFPPVVKFLGPFELRRGETKTHELAMGPYVGAVRFMVVAGTPDGAYGRAELETPVRSELMAFVTAPRVLGPGEKLTVPVSA